MDPWAEFLADPEARARLDAGLADYKAGRWWPFWLCRRDRKPGYRYAKAAWRVFWLKPFHWAPLLMRALYRRGAWR